MPRVYTYTTRERRKHAASGCESVPLLGVTDKRGRMALSASLRVQATRAPRPHTGARRPLL